MGAEALIAVLGMIAGLVSLTWGFLIENSVQEARPATLEKEQTARRAA